jgi:uncharacterized protein YciI/thioredoxin-related protein
MAWNRDWSCGLVRNLGVSIVAFVAAAAQAAPLTWNDLVNRPDRWPPSVNVARDVEFQSGKKVSKATPLRVVEVDGGSATLLSPDGLLFGADPKDCNLVAAANTYWDSLSADQKAVTLATIAADETIRPDKIAVVSTLDFGNNEQITGGTEVNVTKVTPNGINIGHQFIMTTLTPAQTDIFQRARALAGLPKDRRPAQIELNAMSPAQRALTVATIPQDKSIIPAKVTLRSPVVFNRSKAPAGAEVELVSFKGTDVGVLVNNEVILVDASGTDVLKRARALLAMPQSQRPDRMQQFFEGRSVAANGKPMQVPTADMYLLYFSSSTCPRCEVYTPKFVKRVHDTLKGKNVSVVSVANQNAPEALAYAQKSGIDWPIVTWEARRTQLNDFHVNLQPGLVLVDKFGNIIATNAPGLADMATVDTAINKLDEVLASAPSKATTPNNTPGATPSAPNTTAPTATTPAAQPAAKAPNAPLFYAVTLLPGDKWVKGTHLLKQPGIMEHATYWNSRTGTGELVTMGLLDDGLGGALALVQGESLDTVKALIANDPCVKSGLFKADIKPWRAIAWTGEANLPAAAERYKQLKK